jgi:hypothetical protein
MRVLVVHEWHELGPLRDNFVQVAGRGQKGRPHYVPLHGLLVRHFVHRRLGPVRRNKERHVDLVLPLEPVRVQLSDRLAGFDPSPSRLVVLRIASSRSFLPVLVRSSHPASVGKVVLGKRPEQQLVRIEQHDDGAIVLVPVPGRRRRVVAVVAQNILHPVPYPERLVEVRVRLSRLDVRVVGREVDSKATRGSRRLHGCDVLLEERLQVALPFRTAPADNPGHASRLLHDHGPVKEDVRLPVLEGRAPRRKHQVERVVFLRVSFWDDVGFVHRLRRCGCFGSVAVADSPSSFFRAQIRRCYCCYLSGVLSFVAFRLRSAHLLL